MNQTTIKATAAVLALVVVANFVLFLLGKVSIAWFWMIIVGCALFAYVVLPRIRKK